MTRLFPFSSTTRFGSVFEPLVYLRGSLSLTLNGSQLRNKEMSASSERSPVVDLRLVTSAH